LYRNIVILASGATTERSIQTLRTKGAHVEHQAETTASYATLGTVRRQAVAHGLEHSTPFLHLCDWDRVIHWADMHPDELSGIVSQVTQYDCLILGRTSDAFARHPRVQRDTEAIINHCFSIVWGAPIDVTAASRGLSRTAATRIVEECDEPSLGNDCVWPLFLRRYPDLRIGYQETQGLEWETPDRFGAEIAAAGGLPAWIAAHDANLAAWSDRLLLAQIEVDALRRWAEHLSTTS
jgi:hypothetical protein